jgi:hypothetical protein
MVTVLVTAWPELRNHPGRGRKDDATEFGVSLSLSQTYYFYRKSILFGHLLTQGFILNLTDYPRIRNELKCPISTSISMIDRDKDLKLISPHSGFIENCRSTAEIETHSSAFLQ